MTFWNFFEALVGQVRKHVESPGPWPYGVFVQDPTEGLIQYGTACAWSCIEENGAKVVVAVPGSDDVTLHVEMSPDSAVQAGDRIGEILARI